MQHDDEDRRERPAAEGPSRSDDAPTPPAPGPEQPDDAWPEHDVAAVAGTSEVGDPTAEPAPAEAEAATGEAVEEPAAATHPPQEIEAHGGSPEAVPTPGADDADDAPPEEVEAFGAAPAREPWPEPEPALDPTATPVAAHAVPESGSVSESTQCPRCGTENRPGISFCRQCGQRLVASGVATTVERPGAPEGSQACPRCGTHNRTGVAFCQNCGANLRVGATPGYVPPAVAGEPAPAAAPIERRGAVLGPVVLLIGVVGLVTAYLLPFAYGTGSLFERAWGTDGWGVAFWSGYPDVAGTLLDQVYFGLAGPSPILALLVVALAAAGVARARPGALQRIGLLVVGAWSLGLVVLFAALELAANWDGDVVGLLRVLTPAGIIFFLTGLILVIGVLTRFARS